MQKTIPVIFRKFKSDNSIIAFFPTEIMTSDYVNTCLSYEHIGQHGSADINYTKYTLPCTQVESKALYDELIELGYNLRTYKRNQSKWIEFRKKLNRNAEPFYSGYGFFKTLEESNNDAYAIWRKNG
jgi:hypothetical protein